MGRDHIPEGGFPFTLANLAGMMKIRRRLEGFRRMVELTSEQANAIERHAQHHDMSADDALTDLLDRGIAAERP